MNRTLDGRPVTGSISGFSEITTSRAAEAQQPAPILTPTDVLHAINKLKEDLGLPEFYQAITLLFTHVKDTNNPHQTDLDQFATEITTFLYQKYLEAGGTGTLEYYLTCLFKVLRVATLEEMDYSEDPALLVSVYIARLYIERHANDANAHPEMLKMLFPGDPIKESPVFAFYAEYGISKDWMVHHPSKAESLDNYSYVGQDGQIHMCTDPGVLPIDYELGKPMIPCFGARTNVIEESTNFGKLVPINVSTLEFADIAPDSTLTATAITTPHESLRLEHTLLLEDVVLLFDTPRTFSIYAKAETCDYLQIAFKDMSKSDVMVRGIFDLKKGRCFTMNHMNRYRAEIHPIGDGWCRCILTMCHPIGQQSDLHITFFKGPDTDDMKFQGSSEICGYLWGMQLEDGYSASPYIPTYGAPVQRDPISLEIALDPSWMTEDALSVALAYQNLKGFPENFQAPVFVLLDETLDARIKASRLHTGETVIIHQEPVVGTEQQLQDGKQYMCAVHMEKINSVGGDVCYLVHGADKTKYISSVNTLFRESANTYGSRVVTKGTLLIGCDGAGNYLDGYVDSLIIYPFRVSQGQAEFINGDCNA